MRLRAHVRASRAKGLLELETRATTAVRACARDRDEGTLIRTVYRIYTPPQACIDTDFKMLHLMYIIS